MAGAAAVDNPKVMSIVIHGVIHTLIHRFIEHDLQRYWVAGVAV